MNPLPLILEPAELETELENPDLLIIDLGKPAVYSQAHIPGAVHLDYKQIVATEGKANGLMPDEAHLSHILSALGFDEKQHIVAYDDEGGGRACRLLWTLECLGHNKYSLLNGGIYAWNNESRPLTRDIDARKPSHYQGQVHRDTISVNHEYILTHLTDGNVALLDCRSPDEYSGKKKLADRGGHIPGAVNFDWVNAIDLTNALRLKPRDTLIEGLEALGIRPEKEVIVYCQTHHRSAHTYIALKHLGFANVKGYPGSWSQWGNMPNLPVEP
ncbi:MAG: sulfurtransferase [Gammaproteobacteria bacterium]|nr:sulfurtransferase [Gammaproteobacteria bacterium]